MTVGFGPCCAKCGSVFQADERFCKDCGAPRQPAPDAASMTPPLQAGAGYSNIASRAAQGASVASRAYGAAERVAGFAGVGFALPWQRIAGAGRPDIGAFASSAARPGAQRIVQASLKRPGLALAATTVLDVVVAVVTGGTSALYKAIPRLVLGAATSVLSLVTGSKGGTVRKVSGLLGVVTALAQVGFAVYTLVSGLDAGTSGWIIAPQIVAMVSSFMTAAKTTVVAFRRA